MAKITKEGILFKEVVILLQKIKDRLTFLVKGKEWFKMPQFIIRGSIVAVLAMFIWGAWALDRTPEKILEGMLDKPDVQTAAGSGYTPAEEGYTPAANASADTLTKPAEGSGATAGQGSVVVLENQLPQDGNSTTEQAKQEDSSGNKGESAEASGDNGKAEAAAGTGEDAIVDASEPGQEEALYSAARPGELLIPAAGSIVRSYGFNYDETWQDYRMHQGVDIATNSGDTIVAVADGIISELATEGLWGGAVVIDHGDWQSKYYCISPAEGLKVGQNVAAGEIIALAAEPGLKEEAQGCHLHFELWMDGRAQDPSPYWPNA